MKSAQRLLCLAPAEPPVFSVEDVAVPHPSKEEVVVRVEAATINPIDVKRSAGYGQRLLKLKGAGKYPMVLGNDIAGIIESVGKGVSIWQPGDRVFGLVPTGKGGAYATHVAVDSRWLRPFVNGKEAKELVVFPYSFSTLWQSFRQASICEESVKGREVLVHGACGGLGKMALQVLIRWGAVVTAICASQNVEVCKRLGASTAWDRSHQSLSELPQRFDAALNFGAWADEEKLIGALRQGALGMATTVHPLLTNFDTYGWLRGVLQTRRDLRRVSGLAAAKGGTYGWTVFKPDDEALDALYRLLTEDALELPVGISVTLSNAGLAFDHVTRQQSGRAVLLPASAY